MARVPRSSFIALSVLLLAGIAVFLGTLANRYNLRFNAEVAPSGLIYCCSSPGNECDGAPDTIEHCREIRRGLPTNKGGYAADKSVCNDLCQGQAPIDTSSSPSGTSSTGTSSEPSSAGASMPGGSSPGGSSPGGSSPGGSSPGGSSPGGSSPGGSNGSSEPTNHPSSSSYSSYSYSSSSSSSSGCWYVCTSPDDDVAINNSCQDNTQPTDECYATPEEAEAHCGEGAGCQVTKDPNECPNTCNTGEDSSSRSPTASSSSTSHSSVSSSSSSACVDYVCPTLIANSLPGSVAGPADVCSYGDATDKDQAGVFCGGPLAGGKTGEPGRQACSETCNERLHVMSICSVNGGPCTRMTVTDCYNANGDMFGSDDFCNAFVAAQ